MRRRALTASGLCLFLGGIPASASSVIEIRSFNQLRENSVGERELPWVNRFRFDRTATRFGLAFSADGQYAGDPLSDSSAGDLYQASLTWSHRTLGLRANAGRFLLNQSHALVPIDGVEIAWDRRTRVGLRFFGGARRHLEAGDFTRQSGLTGADVRYDPFPLTTLTAGYRYENDFDGTGRHWATGAFRQGIPLPWSPLLYGSIDYQLDGTLWNEGRAGLELHPLAVLRLAGELAYYNEASDEFEWSDRIFRLFARSGQRQYAGSAAIEVTKSVGLTGSYAFHSYEVLPNERETGNLVSAGGRWTQGKFPWILVLDAFYQESHGGKAGGYQGYLEKQIDLNWKAALTSSLARYAKVTGSNDYALHAGARVSYSWTWGLELGLAGEINSNVDQTRDFRIGMLARYLHL